MSASLVSSSPASTSQPEDEQAWRTQAETQLAELRQALATAQAEVAQQTRQLLALRGRPPGAARPAGPAEPVLRYELPGPAASGRPPGPPEPAAEAQVELLTQLLAQNPHPVLRLTPTGDVRYANPAAEALGLAQAVPPGSYLLPLVRKALRLGATQAQ